MNLKIKERFKIGLVLKGVVVVGVLVYFYQNPLPTNILIGFIILLFVIDWADNRIKKEIEKKMDEKMDNKLDSIAVDIRLGYYNFPNHPFVKNRIIPYLKRNGYPDKEITKLKAKKRKELAELNKKYHQVPKQYTDQEIEFTVWGDIFKDLIEKHIHEYGGDKFLAFRYLNNGSQNHTLIWDNLYKNFRSSPYQDYSFIFDLHNPHDYKNILRLSGETVHVYRKDDPRAKYRKIFVIYFELLEPGSKVWGQHWDSVRYGGEYHEDMGVLAELPYNFLESNRQNWWRDYPNAWKEALKEFKLEDVSGDGFPGANYRSEYANFIIT